MALKNWALANQSVRTNTFFSMLACTHRSTRSMREHAPPEEMQAEDAATDAGQARCTQSTHKTQKKHGKERVSKRQYAFQTLHKGSPHFLPRRSIVGGQIVFSKCFQLVKRSNHKSIIAMLPVPSFLLLQELIYLQITNCHLSTALVISDKLLASAASLAVSGHIPGPYPPTFCRPSQHSRPRRNTLARVP
jgi:hypothetical protein